MSVYLADQTLPAPQQALAEYYTRGMGASDAVGDLVRDAARQVADGTLSYADAHDQVIAGLYAGLAGEIDPVHGIPRVALDTEQMEAMEARLGDALADLAVFYDEGGQDERHGTRPEPRADMHPLVADALGIDPSRPVTREELTNLFFGQRADGTALPGRQREIAYIDLCWSADKSVSLAWAFAPTEAERAAILQAHRDAVDAAMRYVETEIGMARRGDPPKPEPAHIGWVSFDHYTSRPAVAIPIADPQSGVVATELHTLKDAPADPNLHTHVAVFNVAVTDDGWAGGLHQAKLKGRVKEFGAYYQAQLATRLREIGADVVLDRKTGAARIHGISDRVRDAFSKRTMEAEGAARDFAREQGVDWDSLTPEAKVDLVKGGAHASRRSKGDAPMDFEAWQRQAEALGWTHTGALRPERAKGLQDRETRIERAYQAALPFVEDMLVRRSVLKPPDLRMAAARGLVATGIEDERDISRVTRLMREQGVTQDGRRTALIWGEDGIQGVRITTALHADQEGEVIRMAREAAADRGGALTRREITAAAEASDLDFTGAHGQAQREAMERLGTAGRLGVFLGAAGAGKTSVLAPIVAAHRARGADIHGVALAWRQADDLAAAGIEPQQLAAMSAFLARAREGRVQLGPQSVVVVDEIGLIAGRQMLDLLRLREQHGFTLLAVGDDRQAQAIEAAPVIGLLRQALGAEAIPEVNSTIRQQTQREREIAGLFRDGQAAEALAMKREDGSLEVVPGGRREAVERVADLWAERVRANAGRLDYSLTVSAPSNAEAREISAAIRERRRAMGEIGREDIAKVPAQDQQGNRYLLTLAKGDRVRLFDRVHGVSAEGGRRRAGNNGTVVEVVAADETALTVRTSRGVLAVAWDDLRGRDRAGPVRLAYGDCLTIDSAQGLTSSEHIAAMPSGSKTVDGFKGYVAATRHRERTFTVTSDGAERQEVVARRLLGDPRPVTQQDVLDNMARNLSRQEAKDTAFAFLKRAREVERGAARGMIGALVSSEARGLEGRPSLQVAQAIERHQARPMLERLAERLEAGLQARRDAALRQGLDAAQARQAMSRGR